MRQAPTAPLPGMQDLLLAIESRDSSRVERALALGALSDPASIVPLIHAVEHGTPRMLELLQAAGADLRAQDEAALRHAVFSGRADMLKVLLAQGARPDVQAGRAVEWAIENETDELASLLISALDDGPVLRRSMRLALQHGRVALAQLCRDQGCPVTGNRHNCLMLAVEARQFASVTWVLRQEGVDPGVNHQAALRAAARNGSLPMVKALIDAGADPRFEGAGYLVAAGVNGHVHVVQAFLEAGADQNENEAQALRWAARDGQLLVVEALLRAGANPHHRNGEALDNALAAGHERVAAAIQSAMQVIPPPEETANQSSPRVAPTDRRLHLPVRGITVKRFEMEPRAPRGVDPALVKPCVPKRRSDLLLGKQ